MIKVQIIFLAGYLFVFGTNAWAEEALVTLKGTDEHSPITGQAELIETYDGIKIKAWFQNVPPGKHGFYIYEYGSCENEGRAAGGHYNPLGVPHGSVRRGIDRAHAGDLGNVKIKKDGTGKFRGFVKRLALNGGTYNIAGRALILHAKKDLRKRQPAGDAGARIACGTIMTVPYGTEI